VIDAGVMPSAVLAAAAGLYPRLQNLDTAMMQAWLGLGANLHQPEKQLAKALGRLKQSSGIKVLKVSHYYRTPPWGNEQQDDFINAVVQIETRLEPLELLHRVQSIENEMGRTRDTGRWGPRVIDIDLLLIDGRSIETAGLEIPHPRMHERVFVLLPLYELDPGLEIPGHGSVGKLLSQLDCDGVHKLDQAGED
jgi:2-amino-4-hydroxy-6-hydroxymethyldihydropteridine diphosphokinase